MQNLISKMRQLLKPQTITIKLPGGGVLLSVMVALVVIFSGYSLVKNVKSSQSASAEQLPGTPGKTEALKEGGSLVDLSEQSIVKFVDPKTGLLWSHPIVRIGNRAIPKVNTFYTKWALTPDATVNARDNNIAVGNKTAQQICQSLGSGWRLPSFEDARDLYNNSQGVNSYRHVARKDNSEYATALMLTSSDFSSLNYSRGTHYYDWHGGNNNPLNYKSAEGMLICVK